MTRSCICNDDVLVVAVIINRSLNTVPRVLDVVKVSPQVASIDDGGVVGLEQLDINQLG